MFGYNEQHAPDHVFDPPISALETNLYLLMCFSTPFLIYTVNGVERGEPGDIIVHTPGFRRYHRALPGATTGFVNDWLYFYGDTPQQIAQSFSQQNVPVNQLIHGRDPLLLRSIMIELTEETLMLRKFQKEFISNAVERIMLLTMRAALDQSCIKQVLLDRLIELRREMMRDYSAEWSLKKMADQLNLSTGRFSVLYKQRFHISPINDLINIRIRAAKLLLKSTNLNIREIAYQCGFQSEYYFSRLFKNRESLSPQQYRHYGSKMETEHTDDSLIR